MENENKHLFIAIWTCNNLAIVVTVTVLYVSLPSLHAIQFHRPRGWTCSPKVSCLRHPLVGYGQFALGGERVIRQEVRNPGRNGKGCKLQRQKNKDL